MSPDRDPLTGLPDDLDLGRDLERTEQVLRVRVESRRYGKPMTIVEGFGKDFDRKSLATTLKKQLGTGGTVKEGNIELQGDHRDRVSELLRDEGYTVE